MSTEYDPTEYGSVEEAARSRAAAEREFGMPSKPYPNTEFGRRVNEHHAEAEDAANREFGGPSRAQTRAKWGLPDDTAQRNRGYDP